MPARCSSSITCWATGCDSITLICVSISPGWTMMPLEGSWTVNGSTSTSARAVYCGSLAEGEREPGCHAEDGHECHDTPTTYEDLRL